MNYKNRIYDTVTAYMAKLSEFDTLERELEAQERARKAALKKPLQKKLEAAEKAMNAANEKLAALDTKIGDTDWYASATPEEVQSVMKERGLLADEVSTLEETWFALSEEIEAIG